MICIARQTFFGADGTANLQCRLRRVGVSEAVTVNGSLPADISVALVMGSLQKSKGQSLLSLLGSE